MISDDPADFEPVRAVARLFSSFNRPWMVAGGWAISLHLRRIMRSHKDVDVAIFREDQSAVQDYLSGWQLYVAHRGALLHWPPDEQLAPQEHVVWAWRPGVEAGRTDLQPDLELLLNERTATDWVYRRDPAVTLPLDRARLRGLEGTNYLAPEIVLLYKSKGARESDEVDFRSVLPLLSGRQRAWLAAAVRRADRYHPWLQHLQGSSLP